MKSIVTPSLLRIEELSTGPRSYL